MTERTGCLSGRCVWWGWVMIVGLCYSFPQASAAQSADQISAEAHQAFREAGEAENAGDRVSAERGYLRALGLVRRAHDRAGEAWVLSHLAGVQLVLGETDSALSSAHQAITAGLDVRDPWVQGLAGNWAAMSHQRLGQPDSALAHFRQALPLLNEVGDTGGMAEAQVGLGMLYYRLGTLDSSDAHCRIARELSRADHNSRREAFALDAMAGIAFQFGRLDSMVAFARRAAALFHEAGYLAGEGRALRSLGAGHFALGRPDSALTVYRSALAILRRTPDRRGEAEVLLDNAGLYESLGRSDSALAFSQLVLDLANAVGDPGIEAEALAIQGDVYSRPPWPAESAMARYSAARSRQRAELDPPRELVMLTRIGLGYLRLGRPDSALVVFRESLRRSEGMGGVLNRAATLIGMGHALSRLHQSEEALTAFRQALGSFVDARDTRGVHAALENIAFEYYFRGKSDRTPSNRRAWYDTAAAYFDSAAVSKAVLRGAAGGDQNRLALSEENAGLVQDAWVISVLARGGVRAELEALGVTERGRAQALLDMIRVGREDPSAVAAAGRDPSALITGAVSPKDVALDFLVGTDSLMIWLLRSDGRLNFFTVPISADSVNALVARYRAALGATEAGRGLRDIESPDRSGAAGLSGPGSAAETASLGRAIAARVIPSELVQHLGDARELVIVPHGSLALLPFAALPLQGDTVPLGERFAVRYAPSLAALVAVQRRSQPTPGLTRARVFRRALVVGNPSMPRVTRADGTRASLSPLPDAEAEGRTLATKLGVRPLTADSAGEGAVRRRMAIAPLIHLATHGFAYSTDARARESFIALAPDATNDGLLTVGEILDDPALELKADLVALSACQTGLGDLKQAEGTVGLQRAFLAKGARSVLVSLWSVSDAATSLLMQRFYAHWLDDRDRPGKADALRRAQADVRSRPEYREPRYWAAFQLVGAD